MLGAELTGKLSMRAGQGLIAGMLVARLGLAAQQLLRPLPLAQQSEAEPAGFKQSLSAAFTGQGRIFVNLTLHLLLFLPQLTVLPQTVRCLYALSLI